MKKIYVLFLFILTLSTGSTMAGVSDTIKADNPLIEYTGRIDFSNPLTPKFSYSGVSVRACFQGTSVSVLLNDEGSSNEYYVIVDHVIKRIKVSRGLTLYPVAAGLTNTVHEIELFRLTELTFGKTSFYGFVVDKGKSTVTIPDKRTQIIEYVGNSITCGYGNEGVLGGKYGPTTQNHYLTYAAYTSRNFNARHLAVCRSGIGIYRNYGDSTTGSKNCMPNNYSRTFLYDASPVYDFKLKPDLICIDLGTNDFSNSNNGFVVDTTRYIRNYISFIDTLQRRNRNADILVLLGPMLSDPTLSTVRRCLHYIVDTANKKNQGKVYFFEMSQQRGNMGIDCHPTVSQHLKNGLELSNYIKQIKGWKIMTLALNAYTLKANEIVVNFNTGVPGNGKVKYNVLAVGKRIGIKKVYRDLNDTTRLHIVLKENIKMNQEVSISYTPGNTGSIDSIKPGRISCMMGTNDLTETK